MKDTEVGITIYPRDSDRALWPFVEPVVRERVVELGRGDTVSAVVRQLAPTREGAYVAVVRYSDDANKLRFFSVVKPEPTPPRPDVVFD